MRDIEFRGKRKDKSGWVFGDLNQHDIHHGKSIIKKGCINNAVIPETVGQYTGLKDKNGVKIFEGDIVEYKYLGTPYRKRKERLLTLMGVVSFKNENSGWSVVMIKDDKGGPFDYHIMAIQGWEVIGNFHDNPELLHANNS
jgi:uncharacterized phage protein (TIGR01671 family)